jgi:hypothetical protein
MLWERHAQDGVCRSRILPLLQTFCRNCHAEDVVLVLIEGVTMQIEGPCAVSFTLEKQSVIKCLSRCSNYQILINRMFNKMVSCRLRDLVQFPLRWRSNSLSAAFKMFKTSHPYQANVYEKMLTLQVAGPCAVSFTLEKQTALRVALINLIGPILNVFQMTVSPVKYQGF